MQETQDRSLVWEDPTCRRATKPMCYKCWACALDLGATTAEAHVPESPHSSRRKASAMRGPRTATREKPAQEPRPSTAKLNKNAQGKKHPPQTSWLHTPSPDSIPREAIFNSLLMLWDLRGGGFIFLGTQAGRQQWLLYGSEASVTISGPTSTCFQSSGAEASMAALLPLAEICLYLSV